MNPRDAITAAANAAEVVVLLRDAESSGDADTLRRAWGFAQPRLRELAAREMREYRQPHAGSAFNVWTTWQARMANLTRRAPDREAMSDTAARRRRDLRERVLAACRLVSLDSAVTKLLLVADVAERVPSAAPAKGLVSGKWFDTFPRK